MNYGIFFISSLNPNHHSGWMYESRTYKIYGRFISTDLNEAYTYRQYCVERGEFNGRYHVKEYPS